LGLPSSTCSLCDAGTYNSAMGVSVCALCATGTYNTGLGLAVSACSPCGTGSLTPFSTLRVSLSLIRY
jgi:hypothetical protein